MKISSVSEMRQMDQSAIETYGIPDEILMENAGLAAYSVLSEQLDIQSNRFLVVCGGGNNGGDGLMVARKIHSNGGMVRVVLLSDPGKYSGAAQTNYKSLGHLPIEMGQLESVASLEKDLPRYSMIIDAIFGTGISRPVEGKYREVIDLLNRSEIPVFSLDIPSGIHGDTGQIMGVAIRAQTTVTFGLPKIGNMLFPGYDRCGKLYVTHISFPPALYRADTLNIALNDPPELPKRNPSGHKGSFGEALFIAGAASYYGAPFFAALSFLKAGGGYARLAAPESMTPYLANKGSEIVFVPQSETPTGSISLDNKEALVKSANQMDMVVLGPGISLDDETQKLARELSAAIEVPLLIDGDGITALWENLDILKQRKAPTVLTPHPGEMSRITGKSVKEILEDSISILQKTAAELNSIVILKGAHTLIGLPGRKVFINMSGNPGMGTAGSGDVLTGTIAAMHGMGLSVEDAVKKGVFLHGLAGDLAADHIGEDGITAADILNHIPSAVKADRRGLPQKIAERYRIPVIL